MKEEKIKIDFKEAEKENKQQEFSFLKKIQKIILFFLLSIFLIILFYVFGFNLFLKSRFLEILNILFFVFIIFFGILIIFFLENFLNFRKKSLEKFAKKYNFFYKDSISFFEKENLSFLFKIGSERTIEGHLEGDFKGQRLNIYHYSHLISFGSQTTSINYLVLETKTQKEYPNFLINSQKIPLKLLFSINTNFKSADFTTESNDFNEKFKIFLEKNFPKEKKIEVLDILTPDLMESFIGKKKYNFLVEFNKNRIFLFKVENFFKELKNLFYFREKEIIELIEFLFEILDEAE